MGLLAIKASAIWATVYPFSFASSMQRSRRRGKLGSMQYALAQIGSMGLTSTGALIFGCLSGKEDRGAHDTVFFGLMRTHG